MSQQHHYKATIEWTGNKGSGTSGYAAYERSHTIFIEGKKPLEASSDKPFRGDATRHNPEDLFLTSIASCHMLWYLHLCADNGIIVESYTDYASGLMETRKEDGGGKFTEIVLAPVIVVQDISMVDKAYQLHKRAHELCFLAASVNFEVIVQPKIKTGS